MKKDNNKKVKAGQGSKKISRALAQISISFTIILAATMFFFKLDNYASTSLIVYADKVIPEFAYSHRNPILTEVMKIISFFGNELLLATAFVFVLLLVTRNKIKDAIIFVIIIFTGFYFNLVLKEFYMRPRPEILPLVQELTYSFPSGHSMNSFIFYSFLSYFIFRSTGNRKVEIFTAVISALLIISVGYSRIYLGVHYPSDVIAGFLAGLFYFSLVLLIEKLIYVINFLRHKNK